MTRSQIAKMALSDHTLVTSAEMLAVLDDQTFMASFEGARDYKVADAARFEAFARFHGADAVASGLPPRIRTDHVVGAWRRDDGTEAVHRVVMEMAMIEVDPYGVVYRTTRVISESGRPPWRPLDPNGYAVEIHFAINFFLGDLLTGKHQRID